MPEYPVPCHHWALQSCPVAQVRWSHAGSSTLLHIRPGLKRTGYLPKGTMCPSLIQTSSTTTQSADEAWGPPNYTFLCWSLHCASCADFLCIPIKWAIVVWFTHEVTEPGLTINWCILLPSVSIMMVQTFWKPTGSRQKRRQILPFLPGQMA